MVAPEIESLYTREEAAIIGYMKALLGNNEPFRFIESDETVSLETRVRRRAIVQEARQMIQIVRQHNQPDEFFEYMRVHQKYLGEPGFEEQLDYKFLEEEHPGLNITGWRVLLVELNPVQYGKNVGRPPITVRGTISHRSAKN